MQIVIEIPEEKFEWIKNHEAATDFQLTQLLYSRVRKGTPLPKDYGRLIDADELEECKEIMNTISGESKYAVRMDDIRNMSTILKADTESENGNEKN